MEGADIQHSQVHNGRGRLQQPMTWNAHVENATTTVTAETIHVAMLRWSKGDPQVV